MPQYIIPAAVLTAIGQALALLPARMDSIEARCMLLSIGLQESRLQARFQRSPQAPDGKGPARGFWQFERGTEASRGGVWGMILHQATSDDLADLCRARQVAFSAVDIHGAIESDDVLAAGLARLLLFSDPKPLPPLGDTRGGWDLYQRTWRPGRPRRETWDDCHAAAVAALDRRTP